MNVCKTAAVAAPLAVMLAIGGIAQLHASTNVWPQQPVKIMVGLAAGGLTDTITRIIAQPLGEQLGQPMVVENRPGASGTIAAEVVARGPADGYTLVMGNLPQMVILPAMQTTKYDPLRDFAPISLVGSNPFVLCVNPKLPVHTLAEFIAYVKERPGQLAFGSGGIGNGTHLSMAYFLKLAGLDMIHVPYKGGAPAMADLVAGHVVANFSSSSDALPQVKAGTVRAIAVSSGTRWPKLPDVPAISELDSGIIRNCPKEPAAAVMPMAQERCCALFRTTGDADLVKWADLHADIIRRFGRFPHRNAVLGRATTAEEQAFLNDGGFAG